MLINKKAVRQLALDRAEQNHCCGRDRVGQHFYAGIEAAVREAVERRVNFHDNKRGHRKTLI